MASSQSIPVEKPNRSRQVAHAIESRIVQGEWTIGSWIPATRLLAEQFEVSRKTVQGALSLLEKRKVISRRARQGCFVRSLPQSTTPRSTPKAQVGVICIGGYTPYIPPPPDDMTRDWGWAIMAGAQEEMLPAEKMMTIIPSHLFDTDPVAALLERIDSIRDSLAGLICFPLKWPARLLRTLPQYLDRLEIPYVTVNRLSDLSHHNFVSADYIGGTRLAGRCLARMGIERVILLETESIGHSHSEIERVGGLFQGYALEDTSTRQIDVLRCANHAVESGYGRVRQYLKENPAPQAVVAMGDYLAQGAIQALAERGLRVPEDVGVIGGTGLPQMRDAVPSLTTLAPPMGELGRQAMRMLMEMERGDVTRLTGRTVPGELVVRQSFDIPESIRQDLANDVEAWTFRVES